MKHFGINLQILVYVGGCTKELASFALAQAFSFLNLHLWKNIQMYDDKITTFEISSKWMWVLVLYTPCVICPTVS